MSALDYVRSAYGVAVEQGQRVTVDGRPGTVEQGSLLPGHYLHVRFDDGVLLPCHPTWRVDYAAALSEEQKRA